jgi:hypothetical protein
MERPGEATQARSGEAWPGLAGRGQARHGRRGLAGRGAARRGKTWQALFPSINHQGGLMEPLSVLIVVVIVAVLLWMFNRHIPLQATVKMVVNVVAVVLLVAWTIYASGVLR